MKAKLAKTKDLRIMIADGQVVTPFVQNNILVPRDLANLSLQDLERNLENALNHNEAFNAAPTSFDRRLTKDNFLVNQSFVYLEKFKECVERNSFTDAFEYAIKLKIHLESHQIFDIFTGETELSFALKCVSFKLTSSMFKALEYLEKNGQLKVVDLLGE